MKLCNEEDRGENMKHFRWQDLRKDEQLLRALHGRDGADQDSRNGEEEAQPLAGVLQPEVQQDQVCNMFIQYLSDIVTTSGHGKKIVTGR